MYINLVSIVSTPLRIHLHVLCVDEGFEETASADAKERGKITRTAHCPQRWNDRRYMYNAAICKHSGKPILVQQEAEPLTCQWRIQDFIKGGSSKQAKRALKF